MHIFSYTKNGIQRGGVEIHQNVKVGWRTCWNLATMSVEESREFCNRLLEKSVVTDKRF